MKEFTRIRCPFCGSMPYPGQLETTEKERPAEVRIILMTIAGKTKAQVGDIPKKGKGRGGHGSISYLDVTEQHPELVEQYKKWFAERALKFAAAAGYIKLKE